MELMFYIFGVISILATLMVVVNTNPVYALFYLIISLLSLSAVFFSIGAYFAGAIETIVYASAIIVLFVFVVMMLNLGNEVVIQERNFMNRKSLIFSVILSISLLSIFIYGISTFPYKEKIGGTIIGVKEVGITLFGPYILVIEFISLLLLSGLVVAFHIGHERRVKKSF
ncbi:NADH-quinone oxidoreductase subunit J [Candidatus Providencia siddallii]|uniref:NADH-quinone oxidoreductase subunit J n=1 Tax=Candidatus Providencia siddallii TaxID=1715285 RepID=A0A0M6WA91_9GAMM|nr:NADH-quinone oxidoreductase subunit J [Candidatus Providencia siddallii]